MGDDGPQSKADLACALRDPRSKLTLFSKDIAVPFSSNLAESELRMAKLQQKTSGSFHSVKGAERLGKVRSYMMPTIKTPTRAPYGAQLQPETP